MKKVLTLCLVHDHPRILLGMKKRGFGVGRWNGFGGKVNVGETIEHAAIREIHEEAGIKVMHLEKMGVIDFEFKDNPEILEVHIFKTRDYVGEPKESEEMKPQWFFIDEIPFSEMWPSDIYWMPLFLSNKKFTGKVLFGESDRIIEQEVNIVNEI